LEAAKSPETLLSHNTTMHCRPRGPQLELFQKATVLLLFVLLKKKIFKNIYIVQVLTG